MICDACRSVEEKPPDYDDVLIAEVQVTVSCDDHQTLTLLMGDLTTQMERQLNELCTEAVQCDSALNFYICQPADRSSIITVNFTVTVKSVTGLGGHGYHQYGHILKVHAYISLKT